MKTLLGTEIPKNIRGVFYFCDFNGKTIKVLGEFFTESAFEALNLYANIPNPESQMASGATYEEMCDDLNKLHNNMKDPEWLAELAEQI